MSVGFTPTPRRVGVDERPELEIFGAGQVENRL